MKLAAGGVWNPKKLGPKLWIPPEFTSSMYLKSFEIEVRFALFHLAQGSTHRRGLPLGLGA
jgi:hypothetical protein